MNEQQKRGALIFFAKGRCSQCHSVAGDSNEMFSDFKMHVIGVPQIAPEFGVGKGNVVFDGPGLDEDFGLEQITGMRLIATSSAARRCAMLRCSRRSSITGR